MIATSHKRHSLNGTETVEHRLGGKWAPGVAHNMKWETLERSQMVGSGGLDLSSIDFVRSHHNASIVLGRMIDEYRSGQLDGNTLVAGEKPVAVWSQQWDDPSHVMGTLSRLDLAGAIRWFQQNGVPQVAFVAAGNSLADTGRDGVMVPLPGAEGQRKLNNPDYLQAPVRKDVVLLGDDGSGMDFAASEEAIMRDALLEGSKEKEQFVAMATQRHLERVAS